jgi:hypothetical protein
MKRLEQRKAEFEKHVREGQVALCRWYAVNGPEAADDTVHAEIRHALAASRHGLMSVLSAASPIDTALLFEDLLIDYLERVKVYLASKLEQTPPPLLPRTAPKPSMN